MPWVAGAGRGLTATRGLDLFWMPATLTEAAPASVWAAVPLPEITAAVVPQVLGWTKTAAPRLGVAGSGTPELCPAGGNISAACCPGARAARWAAFTAASSALCLFLALARESRCRTAWS